MKRVLHSVCFIALAWAQCLGTTAQAVDLRRGVPDDVYLVVQRKHNPERDFQRQYFADVWKTVQETQLLDRVVKIITSRMEAEQVQQAKSAVDELREAVRPIDLKALSQGEEFIYAQAMVMATAPVSMPISQHLVMVRATADTAASTAAGVKNLFALAEKYGGGGLSVVERTVGDATVWTLKLPPQSPFQPSVAHLGEVVVFSSSEEVLTKSLRMISDGTGTSKFDDPRLAAALRQLPEPEDGLVFYDGQSQFAALRKLGPALKTLGDGDKNVDRVVKLLDKVWDDMAIIDFSVTVEYTEGNLNRTAGYTKLLPNTGEATLRKMTTRGQAFDRWYAWVPAGALSYSLGTGINLHPLYERIMAVLREDVPEAAPGLEQFEQIQKQLDLYLDRDLLQSFSGEYVSVSLPATPPGQPDSIFALRCHNPERIKELIHRGMDALLQFKPVRDQQVKLAEAKDLPGFEELSAAALTALGVKPVLGFQDGWMYIGSSVGAVKRVLDAKAGNSPTIEGTEAFQRLKLDVSGPVDSIGYGNTAENIRNAAKTLNQIGFMAPMFLSMAGANAKPEDLKPIQELLALLPDIAKIIGKFDFLEASVSVAQAGKEPDSYVTQSVVVVRPAAK